MLLLQLLFWRIRWIIEKQPIQGFLKALNLATQFYLWVFVPFTEALTAWETVLGAPLPLVMFLNPSKPPGRLACLLIFSTVKEPRQNAHIGWTTLFHQEDRVSTQDPGKCFAGIFTVRGWNVFPFIMMHWNGLQCCPRGGRCESLCALASTNRFCKRSWNWKLQRNHDWDFMFTPQ